MTRKNELRVSVGVRQGRQATWNDKLCALRDEYIQEHVDSFERNVQTMVESPIEELFLGAMIVAGFSAPRPRTNNEPHFVRGRSFVSSHTDLGGFTGFLVNQSVAATTQQEARVGAALFRIDFAFFTRNLRFAVELDGHDFHEASKEQARKDRARERALTSAGWQVIRFTGSEVYADPIGCLVQFNRIMLSTCKARWLAPDDDGGCQ